MPEDTPGCICLDVVVDLVDDPGDGVELRLRARQDLLAVRVQLIGVPMQATELCGELRFVVFGHLHSADQW